MSTKFAPFFVHVEHKPVVIVGECPGKQSITTHICWQFNRSANFLNSEILYQLRNLILTNISLRQEDLSESALAEGFEDLQRLILTFNPSKIILLGKTAMDYIQHIHAMWMGPIFGFKHPSYVLRFEKKTKKQYAEIVRKAILV